jgi:acetolactate synthase-1/2/3 large subunit
LLARQGIEPLLAEKVVLSVGQEAPFIDSLALHLEGCPRALCEALAERLPASPRSAALAVEPRSTQAGSVGPGTSEATPRPGGPDERFDMPAVLARLERELEDGSVVLADAGNTGASVAHYLRAPHAGRWLMAMGMAGMGYTFGAAIGAACASGRRCMICAGDGAFFMHGMEVHTAVQHALPITFVIFDNRAHGMCLMRERYLVGEEHGYNRFEPAHIGAGLGAMLPGLPSHDCASLAELERALVATRGARGPVLLSIELPDVEVPPFAALQIAARRAASAAAKQERQ